LKFIFSEPLHCEVIGDRAGSPVYIGLNVRKEVVLGSAPNVHELFRARRFLLPTSVVALLQCS